MKLKAITTIIHNGTTFKPGSVIDDVSDVDAKVLVAGGFAAEVEDAATTAKAETEAKAAVEKKAPGKKANAD